MPIAVPQAAPPTYAELVEQAVAQIPSVCSDWTDYNPSDPGIMLIELFAWLSEMLHYRIDTIPPAHYWAFLALLNDTRPGNDSEWQKRQKLPLDEAIRQTIQELRTPYRAVTAADYEYLVLHEWPLQTDAAPVARVYCAFGYNLEADTLQKRIDGHISLVVLPILPSPLPTDAVDWQATWLATHRPNIKRFLDQRRLLGIALHVVGPQFVSITIRATLILRPDYAPLDRSTPATTEQAIKEIAHTQATAAVVSYFDPQRWPFGRGVYRSEIYRLLDQLPGVAFVKDVVIDKKATALTQPVAAIQLEAYELVKLNKADVTLDVKIISA